MIREKKSGPYMMQEAGLRWVRHNKRMAQREGAARRSTQWTQGFKTRFEPQNFSNGCSIVRARYSNRIADHG